MTAQRRLKFDKDWKTQAAKGIKPKTSVKPKRTLELEVIRSEDLPKLITINEAADFLRMHRRTVEELRDNHKLKFLKREGRYFTTAEWIADYLESCTVY